MFSQNSWLARFVIAAVLLHVIGSGSHASATNDNSNTASDSSLLIGPAGEQFSIQRDGSLTDGGGGPLGNSVTEEQVPSVVIPSSLTLGNSNNFNPRTNRLLAVPNSLTRFLFSNMRIPSQLVDKAVASQSSQGSSMNGFKRSSSALDSLTGVTLGKRSVGPFGGLSNRMDFVNYEPLTNSHSALFFRTTPRMYDLSRHWVGPYEFAPLERQP